MGAQLTKEQIAQLESKLIVPIAIGDILTYGLDVEQDMQYGLHEALSEIDPDSALLAIALSAKHIASSTQNQFPIAAALYNETVSILNDYGPDFMRDLKRGSLPQADFIDVLKTVPEDLESVADLLDVLCAELIDAGHSKDSPAFVLAELLSIQARAHVEITDFILAEASGNSEAAFFSQRDEMSIEETRPKTQDSLATMAGQNKTGDNIILFPGNSRH
ncbi:MAG: hypothetical protein AAF988_00020 [Pseudomonadota bacterium]